MTEQITIEQQNAEIARFEGRLFYGRYTIDSYGPDTHNAYPEMKYHSSWDWLMPAWYKFRDIKFHNGRLEKEHSDWKSPIDNAICYQGIESAHLLLFHAIKWLNKQQP